MRFSRHAAGRLHKNRCVTLNAVDSHKNGGTLRESPSRIRQDTSAALRVTLLSEGDAGTLLQRMPPAYIQFSELDQMEAIGKGWSESCLIIKEELVERL